MAKVDLIAISRIAISAGKEGLKYVEPGNKFSIEEKDANSLIEAIAARPLKTSAPDGTKTVSDEEVQRLQMLEVAKEEGVKGLTKKSTMETISAKLAKHRQAAIDAAIDAVEGDDDDENEEDVM